MIKNYTLLSIQRLLLSNLKAEMDKSDSKLKVFRLRARTIEGVNIRGCNDVSEGASKLIVLPVEIVYELI